MVNHASVKTQCASKLNIALSLSTRLVVSAFPHITDLENFEKYSKVP